MSSAGRLAAVMSIGAIIGLVPPAAAEPGTPDPAVRVTRIGGDLGSVTEDVNARGTVVGGVGVREGDEARNRPYTWTHGRLRLLDSPAGDDSSFAVRINRRGDVLVQERGGTRLLEHGRQREFADAAPVALNDAGDALLSTPLYQDLSNPNRALLWRDGRVVELVPPGTLPGWAVYPTALNARGEVLLRVYGANLDTVEGSYVWRDGQFMQLHPPGPDGIVAPRFLDDWGRVSGTAGAPGAAAIWDREGHVANLPIVGGAVGFDVRDANNSGQLVGYTAFPDGTNRVTVYTAGRPTLLPANPGSTPAGHSVEINDRGQVAWTEQRDDDSEPVGFAWWSGRHVALGAGTVVDIGDGGDIIGFEQPDGNGTGTFGRHWAVDWRTVLHRR